jgi:uncharacterized repeat protein (TIGR03847 family)
VNPVPTRELDPVTRLTTDAVGVPGRRTFFLQANSGAEQVTLLVEKEQIQLLSERLASWLPELAAARPEDPEETKAAETSPVELQEPLVPAFRVGQLSLSYDADRDRITIVAEELVADPDRDDQEEAQEVRMVVTRPQLRVLAKHGSDVVARGRPSCPLCGNAMDPTGHVCPAQNGHRPFATR